MYTIQGALVSAACLCLCLPNDGGVQMAAIPMFLGAFMIGNTSYHFGRLKYKEIVKK